MVIFHSYTLRLRSVAAIYVPTSGAKDGEAPPDDARMRRLAERNVIAVTNRRRVLLPYILPMSRAAWYADWVAVRISLGKTQSPS